MNNSSNPHHVHILSHIMSPRTSPPCFPFGLTWIQGSRDPIPNFLCITYFTFLSYFALCGLEERSVFFFLLFFSSPSFNAFIASIVYASTARPKLCQSRGNFRSASIQSTTRAIANFPLPAPLRPTILLRLSSCQN